MKVLALDFGGTADPAAAALLDSDGSRHHVSFLARWFGDFAQPAVDHATRLRPEAVVYDGTGPQAVEPLERLTGSLQLLGVPLFVVKVVRNSREPGQRNGSIFVPKVRLVMAAQHAIEERRLTVDRALSLAPVLASEISGYRQKTRPDGLLIFEHETRRLHDDLFSCVQLGTWFAEHQLTCPPARLWRPYG